MLAAFTIAMSLLLLAAGSVDITVATLPAKGDITLPMTPAGKVDLKREGTVTRVRIELDRLAAASTLGPAAITYVAWAVSPEGSVDNIGEIDIDKDKGRLDATTRFEQVGILITGEPHYMVDRPSSMVAFRTQAPSKNDFRAINVSLEVGLYDYSSLKLVPAPGVSNLVLEARTAYEIAKLTEADRWAEPEFRRARVAIDTMEEMVNRASPIPIVSQSANEVIRRAQQAVIAAREKKAAVALENARNEITLLKQESQTLASRIQMLTEQQTVSNAAVSKLQGDLANATRERQAIAQERDQLVNREKAISRELSDLKARQEELKARLVLQLSAEFFDLTESALTATGREALARLAATAAAIPGQVRLDGPAPDVVFEAARQYLLQAGIPPERIILKR